MLINEIILTEETQELKDGEKVTLNKVVFVYDKPTNTWSRKSDGTKINPNGEEHKLLMAYKGFQADGQSQLQPGLWATVKKTVNDAMGGPLGLASRTDPKATILGKIMGTMGDALGRALDFGIDKYRANKQAKQDATNQPEPEKSGKQLELF